MAVPIVEPEQAAEIVAPPVAPTSTKSKPRPRTTSAPTAGRRSLPLHPSTPTPQQHTLSHRIPNRGSVSSLLQKLGAGAKLPSFRLTKTSAARIAPLHLVRRTPPPIAPPLPVNKKKKKKDEDEIDSEEEYEGLTEKQIKKLKEEKRMRAWYSP